MKRVDRLLIKVRKAAGETDKQLSLALVDYVWDGEHKGQWKVTADLWDGKEGSGAGGDRLISYHATQEEALKAIEAIEEIHNPCQPFKKLFKDVPVINLHIDRSRTYQRQGTVIIDDIDVPDTEN